MFFKVERREFSEEADRYFVSGERSFFSGCKSASSSVNFVITAYFGVESVLAFCDAKISKLVAPYRDISEVLRRGCQAQVGSSVIQGIVIDVINDHALWGIHNKSMEMQVSIKGPGLGVHDRPVFNTMRFLSGPSTCQNAIRVIIIYDRFVSLCERNNNSHIMRSEKAPGACGAELVSGRKTFTDILTDLTAPRMSGGTEFSNIAISLRQNPKTTQPRDLGLYSPVTPANCAGYVTHGALVLRHEQDRGAVVVRQRDAIWREEFGVSEHLQTPQLSQNHHLISVRLATLGHDQIAGVAELAIGWEIAWRQRPVELAQRHVPIGHGDDQELIVHQITERHGHCCGGYDRTSDEAHQ